MAVFDDSLERVEVAVDVGIDVAVEEVPLEDDSVGFSVVLDWLVLEDDGSDWVELVVATVEDLVSDDRVVLEDDSVDVFAVHEDEDEALVDFAVPVAL